ncbi:MAG: hypothetical protein QM724_13875 [Flavobacteriales bacterium]
MRITTLPFLLVAALLTAPAAAQEPVLVRDFYPGASGSFVNHGRPLGFRIHDGKLLLFANDGPSLAKLFALDDLSGNVQELAQVGGVLGYTTTNGGIIASGDNLYFFGQQTGSINSILWRLNSSGVAPIDTIPYQVLFYHTGIPLPGGRLIFPSSDPDHGFEPWVTDGTAAGTHRLKDINPGTAGSLGSPFPLFQGFDFNGQAYFLANDGTNGMQLWTSDGTEAGTHQFAVVNTAGATGAIALTYSKNDEHFIVGGVGQMLVSDGGPATPLHTAQFALAHTAGLNYPEASGDGWMYFSAAEDQWKLYRTRGTPATTELVFSGTPNQGYQYLTELNGKNYALTADNEHAYLVALDPATHTSTVVKTFEPDPNAGPSSGSFYGFRNDGRRFYFMGLEGTHHRQYWRSDGTLAGTQMVHEYTPSLINGGPDAATGQMIIFNGHFVFSANDGSVGAELFALEGVVGVAENTAASPVVKAWCDAERRITVQAEDGTLTALHLLDAAGRTLDTRSGLSAATAMLGTQGLPAGVYLVRVVTTKGSGSVRLVLP